MIALTLAELARVVGGEIVASAADTPDTIVDDVVETDSRLVATGAIFFAIPGAATDGHRFVGQAVDAGAALVIVEHRVETAASQIIVRDGVRALADLAHHVVESVRTGGALTVIGITGSNGKTTTKNLLRAILSPIGPTVAPRESFNNHIGAPLSMLAVTYDTQFLVVEMGASGVGEIARIVKIARPDIAVVLKVGLAHAGEFGGIEATQRAKAEIVTSLLDTDVAILNSDDDRVAAMQLQTRARVVWFGLGRKADVRADDIEAGVDGTAFELHTGGRMHPVHLRILGEHHVMNAIAALAVARELGLDLDLAIRSIEQVARAERWRMEVLDAGNGITVINDAYNASPDSMAAALKTLAQIGRTGRRTIAILGEMAELGEFALEEHDRIGRLVVRLNIDQLIVVGQAARHISTAAGLEGSWDGESVLVETADDAWELVQKILMPGDAVLVKSSKSANLRFLGDRLAGVPE